MKPEEIDTLATAMAAHLPCTVASIADAIRKALNPPKTETKAQ